jgi:5-methylcytosine-specific restriction endonuclease McrA
MANGLRKTYSFTCKVCDKPGKSYNNTATMHDRCQKVTANRGTPAAIAYIKKCRQQSQELVKITKNPQESKHTKGRYLWVSGYCVICEKTFTDWGPTKTCSTNCSKRLRKMRQKAVHKRRIKRLENQYIHDVDSLVVWDRDNYTCQLCSKPVEMHKKVPAPLAPTLDHKIPLALGGSHSYSNTQLAHFICNSLKSDNR